MGPDNTGSLISAARRRRELTRAKAIQAIRELDHAGTPVTFEAVARAGGVSRSWLYSQPDIRADIERLRNATQQAPSPPIPASQRASDPSLRQRLAEATERNRQLTQDNARLRRQLAHALGDQRASPPSH
jgi:small-conductance mechanosensitive channel